MVKIPGLRPALWDGDGIINGTYIGLEDDPADADFAYVWYVPVNGGRAVRTETAVKRTHIHPVVSPNAAVPGAEPELVFIYSGSEKSALRKIIGDLNSRRLAEAEEEIKTLRISLATQQQITDDANTGVEKQKAKLDAFQKTRPEHPFGERPQRPEYGRVLEDI